MQHLARKKKWNYQRKGNLNRKIGSLLITARNNARKTNYVKTTVDKTQQNIRCRLWGDRCKMINHIISECSKLAHQVYKTIPFPVQNASSSFQNVSSSFQNGNSSFQNGNSSVQNGKIIISINIKNIL